jgi:EmrB/QacA subfamily drug resistance transporter
MASASDHQHKMTGAQKSILAVVMLGTLMSAIDVTIVLLAIPDITKTLSTNLATSIWVILVYLLVVAILTTQLGKIGDIFGRGRMFNFGFLVFTIASALCALSFNIYMLIFFRILQGIGGALLQANSGAIIADAFEREQRGKAFGYTTLGWNMGSMLGIVLGGVLTTFAGWPYIFYINVPIGIISLYLGFKYIKTTKTTKQTLDLKGMVALSISLLLITLGATSIASYGVSTFDVAMLAVGIIILPIFILLERDSKSPTIDINTFKNKILANSILASFFQSLGYLAIAFVIIMYLQGVRGLSPLDAALLLIPGYVLSGFAAPRMGRLSDKFGARVIATIGLLLMLSTILIYLTLSATTSYYLIVFATIVSGIGSAMFYPANTSAVMANAQGDSYGSTSGLLRTMGNIGTLGSFVLTLTVASLAVSRTVAFQVFLGTSDLTGNISVAFLTGIHAVFIISGIILIIAIILSATRGKEQRQNWQAPVGQA